MNLGEGSSPHVLKTVGFPFVIRELQRDLRHSISSPTRGEAGISPAPAAGMHGHVNKSSRTSGGANALRAPASTMWSCES